MVVDSLRLGGAESILSTLARAAPAGGFVFDVASLDAAAGPTATMRPLLEGAGVATRFLSLPRLVHPRALPALVRVIRGSAYDIVHAHLEHAITLAPPAAALTRRPAVCTFHHMPGRLSRKEALKDRLAIEVGSRADAALFVSKASMDSYASRYGARRTWQVLHNGVDLEAFTTAPAPWPPDLGIPPGVPVVSIVAALRPRKGHRDALAAWPAVLARHPDAVLLLVGSGPEEARLRAQAADLQLQAHIVFAGLRTDVARILCASTLVVLPTRTEALPTVLIEAAASGRAAVASDIPGVREVLVDGQTGLTVPVGDVGALEASIVRLLGDERLRGSLGAQARRRAETSFGMDLWARRLGALYERLVAGRPAGAAG
jgi:glycosyltransferase involved in cell wall biosynthesis